MEEGPHRKIPWITIILGILALIAFLSSSGQVNRGGVVYDVMNATGIAVPPGVTIQGQAAISPNFQESSSPRAPQADYSSSMGVSSMLPPYPYGGTTLNANDTREYNKIYYNASMQTRDVPKLVKRVETVVRGHDGRVDSITSADKYGSVGFVIPQSEYDQFRDELESLVNARFLKVSINSQNMLPQKQAIEKQQDYTNMSLDQLSSARKKEIADYNKKKGDIQYQIDANDRESALLQQEFSNADQAARANITSRQMTLITEQSNLKSQLSTLEKTHLNAINSIDAQVRYQEGNSDALQKQDQALLDDVATVNGTISVQWISLWQMAQIYLPGYTIPGILALFAIISYWWERRRKIV